MLLVLSLMLQPIIECVYLPAEMSNTCGRPLPHPSAVQIVQYPKIWQNDRPTQVQQQATRRSRFVCALSPRTFFAGIGTFHSAFVSLSRSHPFSTSLAIRQVAHFFFRNRRRDRDKASVPIRRCPGHQGIRSIVTQIIQIVRFNLNPTQRFNKVGQTMPILGRFQSSLQNKVYGF